MENARPLALLPAPRRHWRFSPPRIGTGASPHPVSALALLPAPPHVGPGAPPRLAPRRPWYLSPPCTSAGTSPRPLVLPLRPVSQLFLSLPHNLARYVFVSVCLRLLIASVPFFDAGSWTLFVIELISCCHLALVCFARPTRAYGLLS